MLDLDALVGQRPPGYVRVRTTLEWKQARGEGVSTQDAESMVLLSFE